VSTQSWRNRLAALTLLSIVLLDRGASGAAADSRLGASDGDDRAVIAAVLDHTVRRDGGRQAMTTPPPIFVFDRSSRLCKDAEPKSACVPLDEVDGIFNGSEPVFTQSPDDAVTGPSIVRELIESFKSRNETSYRLPGVSAEDVVMVSSNDIAHSRGVRWGDPSRGYSLFSRPAYARTDYALVHYQYSCGVLCGHARVFVLRKTRSGWHVGAAGGGWIS